MEAGIQQGRTARVLGWGVHLLTASGAVVALFALQATLRHEFHAAMLWLALALAIDGIDGSLARACRVAEHIPKVDGRRLDDIVDYLNYVFVPIVFMLELGSIPHSAWAAAPLLASAYGFSQSNAKNRRSFLPGFPFLLERSGLLCLVAVGLPPSQPTLDPAIECARFRSPAFSLSQQNESRAYAQCSSRLPLVWQFTGGPRLSRLGTKYCSGGVFAGLPNLLCACFVLARQLVSATASGRAFHDECGMLRGKMHNNDKTGVLLINLGTPDSPSVADVRRYLREFLSDPAGDRYPDASPYALALWNYPAVSPATFRRAIPKDLDPSRFPSFGL